MPAGRQEGAPLPRALARSEREGLRPPTMPTLAFGQLPPPGVWHDRGQGARRDEKALIGLDMQAKVGNDFLIDNSFFANSGAQVQPATRPKELHLDVNLVPFAQPTAPSAPLGRSPSKAPGRRISAHCFEDMTTAPNYPVTISSSYSPSKLAAPPIEAGSSASPQRMYVDGQWRLSTSLSSPSLPMSRAGERHPPDRQMAGDIGKQFVYSPNEKAFLHQNRALADAQVEREHRETRLKREGERSALGDWRSRWGFEATPGVEFSRSRRKPFSEAASKPTLQGFVGF